MLQKQEPSSTLRYLIRENKKVNLLLNYSSESFINLDVMAVEGQLCLARACLKRELRLMSGVLDSLYSMCPLATATHCLTLAP